MFIGSARRSDSANHLINIFINVQLSFAIHHVLNLAEAVVLVDEGEGAILLVELIEAEYASIAVGAVLLVGTHDEQILLCHELVGLVECVSIRRMIEEVELHHGYFFARQGDAHVCRMVHQVVGVDLVSVIIEHVGIL